MELWKIKMKTTSAGPDGVKQAGKEYQVSSEEAKQLIPVYADLIWKPENNSEIPEIPEAPETPDKTLNEFPKKIENGLYLLSDGTEFKGGKQKAIEAENALKG
jgi:hypothetical protein